MSNLQTKVARVLPPAVALWPKLSEADGYQPVNKEGYPNSAEKRRYLLNLKFNDEDRYEVDAWLRKCLAYFDIVHGRLPWSTHKTGEPTLLCHSGERHRPAAFDRYNIKVSPVIKIGGGSKLKVFVIVRPYISFGGGISLRVDSYQILDLKQQNDHPFTSASTSTRAKTDSGS